MSGEVERTFAVENRGIGTPDYEAGTRHQQTLAVIPIDDNFAYNVWWNRDVRSDHSFLISRWTAVAAQWLEIRFYGRICGIIYNLAADHGIANITIDGVAFADIDMYNSFGPLAVHIYGQTRIITTLLDPGVEHTFRLTCSGTRNPLSTGDEVNILGLIVQGGANPQASTRALVTGITPVFDGARFHELMSYDSVLIADNIPSLGMVGHDGAAPQRLLTDATGRIVAVVTNPVTDPVNVEEVVPDAIIHGQVEMTGAAQQFPNAPCRSITLENDSDRSQGNAVVYIGNDATVAANTGYPLRPGCTYSMAIDNANRIWCIGTALDIIGYAGVL